MKNMTNMFRFLSVILLSSTIALFSCQKENSKATQEENEQFAQVASESDAESEAIFDDVFDNVMGVNTEVGVGGTGVFGQANYNPGEEIISGVNGIDSTPACLTVTITRLSQTAFPVKIVMDFGSGCVGRDGRTRKGKIITVYTGRLVNSGSVAETTFDGYYINNIHVEGTHRVENKSTSNLWIFQVKVTNAKLSKENGNYSEWNSTKTIAQIEGNATPFNVFDDVFSVSGEANGAVKRDNAYYQWGARTLADNALIKKFICRWIVKGKIAFRRSNAEVAVLDYGNGNCDNKATISIGGVVYEISLD
ncbi:MAG TPA: hypothetical protein VEV87_10485 [Chitinophagaceae bacterium]|nr:hypothetical protein [Chitinophagaceae bacterium]